MSQSETGSSRVFITLPVCNGIYHIILSFFITKIKKLPFWIYSVCTRVRVIAILRFIFSSYHLHSYG